MAERPEKRIHERLQVCDHLWIVKRGARGLWSADFWHQNRHCRRALRTTEKKLALRAAARLAADLLDGTYAAKPRINSIKIGDAVARYLDDLRTRGRAPKTIIRYDGELRRFAEYAGTRGLTWLHQLKRRHGEDFRRQRSGECAPKTLFHELVVAKQFLRWCVNEELLVASPWISIKAEKPYQEPRGGPSLCEMETILSAHRGQMADVLATLFFTGMRAGELERLRVEDVDLAENWIQIRSRPGAETKTRRSRKVPIHERLLPVLERQLGSARTFLFAHEGAASRGVELPVNANKLNDRYVARLRDLGIKAGRPMAATRSTHVGTASRPSRSTPASRSASSTLGWATAPTVAWPASITA